MKTLIIDCGATKADWLCSDGTQLRTPGFNLSQTPPEQLQGLLDAAAQKFPDVDALYLYAAGLVGEPPVDLGRWFPHASIACASDMLGAARAVCGSRPGIAAIMGTGANSCQYNGEQITAQVHCGGFILGDEGSAAVLGKIFLSDYLKGLVPEELAQEFAQTFPASYPEIVRQVYRTPAPARYLGSLAPFVVARYKTNAYAKELVDKNFRAFFERTVQQYDALPLGIVGGFGFACRDILQELAAEYGFTLSRIIASPLEGLKLYHGL